jgi:hypothetical protein
MAGGVGGAAPVALSWRGSLSLVLWPAGRSFPIHLLRSAVAARGEADGCRCCLHVPGASEASRSSCCGRFQAVVRSAAAILGRGGLAAPWVPKLRGVLSSSGPLSRCGGSWISTRQSILAKWHSPQRRCQRLSAEIVVCKRPRRRTWLLFTTPFWGPSCKIRGLAFPQGPLCNCARRLMELLGASAPLPFKKNITRRRKEMLFG